MLDVIVLKNDQENPGLICSMTLKKPSTLVLENSW